MKPSQDIGDALRDSLQYDPHPQVRKAAADSLGNLGLPIASDALISALSDPSPEIRESAAKALGKMGPTVFSSFLLKEMRPLLKDHFWKVRYASCKALGRFGEPASSCLDELLKVLIHGTVLRSQVAIAIANFGELGENALISICNQNFGQVNFGEVFISEIDLSQNLIYISFIKRYLEPEKCDFWYSGSHKCSNRFRFHQSSPHSF